MTPDGEYPYNSGWGIVSLGESSLEWAASYDSTGAPETPIHARKHRNLTYELCPDCYVEVRSHIFLGVGDKPPEDK